MRVDPYYVTNMVGSLDQAQANEQQLSSQLSSGVSITSLAQNPVARGRMCCCSTRFSRMILSRKVPAWLRASCRWPIRLWGSVVTQLTQPFRWPPEPITAP